MAQKMSGLSLGDKARLAQSMGVAPDLSKAAGMLGQKQRSARLTPEQKRKNRERRMRGR